CFSCVRHRLEHCERCAGECRLSRRRIWRPCEVGRRLATPTLRYGANLGEVGGVWMDGLLSGTCLTIGSLESQRAQAVARERWDFGASGAGMVLFEIGKTITHSKQNDTHLARNAAHSVRVSQPMRDTLSISYPNPKNIRPRKLRDPATLVSLQIFFETPV